METLLKADIFFFITTIIVIILGIMGIVIGFYVAHIAKQVKKLFDIVNGEMVHVVDDVEELREKIKDKAKTLSTIAGALTTAHLIKKINRESKSKSKKKKD